MHPILVVVLVVVLSIAIVASRRQMLRRATEWRAAARMLGVDARPPGPFRGPLIRGSLRGYELRVDTLRKDRQGYTRYRLSYPALGLGLRLKREGPLAAVARMFGAQDIEVGDRAFDASVVVQAASAKRVRAFLTPVRRRRIQRAFNSHPGLVIEDSSLTLQSRGIASSRGILVSTVKSLVRLAHTISRPPKEAPAPLDRALEEQAAGRLDEALALARGHADEDEPDPDAHVFAGEILLAAGRHAEAAELLAGAGREQPDDPEVQELAAHATALAAPRPAPDPAAPAPPAQVADARASSPAATGKPAVASPGEGAPVGAGADGPLADPVPLCEELFASGMLSTEAARAFEERFAGRRVRWSGELQRVDAYYSDLVFGQGPGCKAVVELCEVQDGPYGGRGVQAVVQLPAEAEEGLRAQSGATIAFEGRLARCDAFMRNVFVGDGRLAPAGAVTEG